MRAQTNQLINKINFACLARRWSYQNARRSRLNSGSAINELNRFQSSQVYLNIFTDSDLPEASIHRTNRNSTHKAIKFSLYFFYSAAHSAANDGI